jgi:uncharacterized membrane protein (DUF373 family)
MKSASGLWTKELKSGGSVTNKILTLKSEFMDLHSKWKTLSLYERFEQTVVSVLTLVIAIIITLAAWQLLLHTLRLVETHAVNPADSQAFQGLFGMVLTVLIALLALVRRFIILDLYQTTPTVVAALAGAALALGIVFWLVTNCAPPLEEDVLQE